MTVLIVDDDPAICFILQKLVERLRPGERVVTAADGRAVLPYIASASLLITDVMMPEMDGIALVKAVRAAGHTYPILIISADTRRKAEAITAGATNFVSKGELFTALPPLVRA
jgi:CheY-like chemotaxis protein